MIAIKDSISYKKLKRIVEYSKSIDTAELTKEIESLHAGRQTRALNTKGLSTRKLVDASLQDQSYRSRLVEILIVTTKAVNMLQAAIGATTEKLMMDLNQDLISAGYRSISDRQSYISSRLHFSNDCLNDLNTVMEIANLVIADIDTAGWALKRTAEVMAIVTKPENLV